MKRKKDSDKNETTPRRSPFPVFALYIHFPSLTFILCFVLAGTAPLETASSPFIKKKQKADPKGAVRADED